MIAVHLDPMMSAVQATAHSSSCTGLMVRILSFYFDRNTARTAAYRGQCERLTLTLMAAEEVSIHRELSALREGQAALQEGQAALREGLAELRGGQNTLREGQLHLADELDLLRREVREDIRDVRAQVAAVQNGQLVFAAATVAGLLGVIATLIVEL